MFERGSFIKWTGTDDDGTFTYVGQVTTRQSDTIIFEDAAGVAYGIHKDDGKFESTKKPKNWNRSKSETISATNSTEKKQPLRRKATGGTKLDQVIALLQANKNLITNRKAAIEKIVTEIGMTPAGASTYFSNAKKAVV